MRPFIPSLRYLLGLLLIAQVAVKRRFHLPTLKAFAAEQALDTCPQPDAAPRPALALARMDLDGVNER